MGRKAMNPEDRRKYKRPAILPSTYHRIKRNAKKLNKTIVDYLEETIK